MFFKMRSAYSVAVLSAALTVAAVASANYKADSPEIVVKAKGPLGMNIDGKSKKLIIEESDSTITFKTFLNTIDTGNGMRNEHMQKRLGKVAKRNAQGKVERDEEGKAKWQDFFEIKLSVPKDKIDPAKSGDVNGTLSFHQVSKPVTVHYSVAGNRVSANFAFNVHEHFPVNDAFTKDDQDKLLCNTGVCAKPEVKVEVSFNYK
jgi:polyisoprenoid-binding protein YceI